MRHGRHLVFVACWGRRPLRSQVLEIGSVPGSCRVTALAQALAQGSSHACSLPCLSNALPWFVIELWRLWAVTFLGYEFRLHRRDERPLIAAGDGGERQSQNNHQTPSGHTTPVTPQNLRDNPERLAKVKTEMCHFIDENGGFTSCPFGVNCEYSSFTHCLTTRM